MGSRGGDSSRAVLRRRLLMERETFVAGAARAPAEVALTLALTRLIEQLEPECLGIYWPMRAESNAPLALAADATFANTVLALPFAHRTPVSMDYHVWNRIAPTLTDDCGIATAAGAPVVPDVVLAPCLGFTTSGLRLGYGGGYFDRWLAAHPHVTAIGVAWAIGRVDEAELPAQSHDVPMAVVVTELGAVGG